MAKKIVRGITDVKTITNQDFDTNNVNDLLSDGQYNYIHRKKGKNEEYHNLTDNIKTLSSDNTELLSVTNYNKTTNTALLSPKHDKQKEQLLESTRNTISIHHGTNATAEKTTVDTNPEKVLEHENLISDSEFITLQHQTGENTTHIQTTALKEELNQLHETKQDVLVAGDGITIEEQTISATGATSSIEYRHSDGSYQLFKYVVTDGYYTFVTYTFNVNSGTPQITFVGDLKNDLERFVGVDSTVSNGALKLTNDGTDMKLINNKSTESGSQQGTFTFYDYTGGGEGGGDLPDTEV